MVFDSTSAVRWLEQVCGKIIGQISKYTMLKQLPGTPEGSNCHVEIREEFASPHAGNVAGNQSSPVYSSPELRYVIELRSCTCDVIVSTYITLEEPEIYKVFQSVVFHCFFIELKAKYTFLCSYA